MKKNVFILTLFFIVPFYGQVSSGELEPNPSAQLDVSSYNKGVLIPRVELNIATDMAPIVNTGTLPISLLVFHKAVVNKSMSSGYYYWDNDQWNKVVTQSELDVLTANNGVIHTDNNFSLGGSLTNPVTINTNTQSLAITGSTTNAFSVAGKTLSVDAATSRVGIGTNDPQELLHIDGGKIRYVDGNQAANKVLTSDSNGNASWKTPAVSAITHALSSTANTITSNVNGNIGTALAINSNNLTVSGTSLTSTVNGVASISNLQSLVQSVDLSGTYWSKKGNSTTTSDYLGTTNAQPLIIRTNNTEKLRVQADGKIGIGTSTPTNQLTVGGNNDPVIHLHSIGNANGLGGSLLFTELDTNFGMKIKHNTAPGAIGVEGLYFQATYGAGFKTIMILDQMNNRVGIGTTAPTADLSVNGTANKTGGGSWTTFSDIRMKKNIQPYTKGLNEIMKINPVTFQYNGKGGYSEDGKIYTGILAQEIEKILPSTVTTIKAKDFEDQRIFDSSEIIYALINAIKEQQKQIENLTMELQLILEKKTKP